MAWNGTINGVTDPTSVMSINVSNINKIAGIESQASLITYDLTIMSYNSTFDMGTELSIGIRENILFSPDGTKLYGQATTEANTDTTYQYDLSTAWDLSTAVDNNKSFLPGQYWGGRIRFNDDGTKMFSSYLINREIYEFTLSTPYDITTGTQTSTKFDYSSYDYYSYYNIGNNGTKLYLLNTSNDTIYQYTMSTAWDLSTASYDNKSYAPSNNGNVIEFSPDGTKLYLSDTGYIYQHDLSTAWDISTASYTSGNSYQLSNITSYISGPIGIFWKPDGIKLYFYEKATNAYLYELVAIQP